MSVPYLALVREIEGQSTRPYAARRVLNGPRRYPRGSGKSLPTLAASVRYRPDAPGRLHDHVGRPPGTGLRTPRRRIPGTLSLHARRARVDVPIETVAVSYTHLTLPTIYS